MTIQKLSGIQNYFSGLLFESSSYHLPNTLPLPFYGQDEADLPEPLSAFWLKLGVTCLATVGVVATAYLAFRRCLNVSTPSEPTFKKNHDEESFIGKILRESSETIKTNYMRSLESGDKAFDEKWLHDAEKHYAEALKIISHQDISNGAVCAKKLGDVYLAYAQETGFPEDKKENCIKAAGLLNFGLLLASKQKDEELQKEIQETLDSVEKALCTLCTAKTSSTSRSFLDDKNREILKKIRRGIQNRLSGPFGNPEKVKTLFQDITSEMKAFTVDIIKQSLEILGEPPLQSKFVVIGFGSMARGEMTPFSDVEFAILIEKDTQEAKEYFRNLTYLMHLRVINLRETIVPILGIKALDGFYDDTTLRGFAFDGEGSLGRGYKTPLGKKGSFELIQTPEGMAGLQGKNGDKYWYQQEPFLPTELHNVIFIYGEESLVGSYRIELNTALNMRLEDGLTLKQYYAKKHLLSEDMNVFGAGLTPVEEGTLFELKKDLYRMSHLFVERLFLSECEKFPQDESLGGTFSKIDWLLKKDKFCTGGAKNLKWMLGRVLLTRLKNCYRMNSAKSFHDPIGESSGEIDETVCNISHVFCLAIGDPRQIKIPLEQNPFYLKNQYLLAKIKERLCKYEEANKHILDYLETHSDNFNAFMLSLRISKKLGNKETFRLNLDKAAKILESKSQHSDLEFFYLSKLGFYYHEIGMFQEGAKLMEQAKGRVQRVNLSVFSSIDLAATHLINGELKKAQAVLEQTLQTLRNQSIQINPRHRENALMHCLSHLSRIYQQQNNMRESIKCAEESLTLSRKIYGKHHQNIAERLLDLGSQCFFGGAHEKGVQYLKERLEIVVGRLGKFHIASIHSYLYLSLLLNKIDANEGIVHKAYLEKAEKLVTQDAFILSLIASAWLRINRQERAEEIFLRVSALPLQQKSPFSLASFYNILGNLSLECHRTSEALLYAELALKENRKIHGNQSSLRVATDLINLAGCRIFQLAERRALLDDGQKESIIKQLEEAERIGIEINETANANELFSDVYKHFGLFEGLINYNKEGAISYFIKSLSFLEALYGPESGNLIELLGHICGVYSLLPDKEKEFQAYSERFECLKQSIPADRKKIMHPLKHY